MIVLANGKKSPGLFVNQICISIHTTWQAQRHTSMTLRSKKDSSTLATYTRSTTSSMERKMASQLYSCTEVQAHTVFFDPAVYRVVLFDQRGAGRSLPPAELRENTSQFLVADIESLRMHLGINKWFMVFGGSWGSTLSLLYAQTHPENVRSLVVRGVFNERREELQFSRGPWSGAARVFPEQYDRFLQYLPPEDRYNPIAGYYKLVTSEDYDTRLNAARSWNLWDSSIGELVPVMSPDQKLANLSDTWLLQHARMETHYAVNGGFMEDGQILKPENLAKIGHLPCTLNLKRSKHLIKLLLMVM